MNKKIMTILAGIFMVVYLSSSTVFADTVTTSATKKFCYRDSLIKSWVTSYVYSTFKYSYERYEKRLNDQKSIHVQSVGFWRNVTNVSKTWDWYTTNTYKGTGRGTTSWKASFGIETEWGNIGVSDWNWVGFYCVGDGTTWFTSG